ncbi:MAG: DUF4349 domain-containing protein [Planctomycetota bacterium]
MPPKSSLPTLKKIAALLFLAFVALFVTRLLLGFVFDFKPDRTPSAPLRSVSSGSYSDRGLLKDYRRDYVNNYAALEAPAARSADTGPIAADLVAQLEVYTREARISGVTGAYDEDVAAALRVIQQHQAEVRLESVGGIKPYRTFNVVIRTPVEQFDACVAALREIGEINSFNVTKEDKSDEVRQRFAEREALREHVASLTKLRSTDGKVSDLVSLEAQIQTVQKQIQSLDIALGEFTQKASYNNVNFSLTEQIEFFVDEEAYPLSARLVAAFVWTLRWYFLGIALAAFLFAIKLSVATLREK